MSGGEKDATKTDKNRQRKRREGRNIILLKNYLNKKGPRTMARSSKSRNDYLLVGHSRVENGCRLGNRHGLECDVAGAGKGGVEKAFAAEENVGNAFYHLDV